VRQAVEVGGLRVRVRVWGFRAWGIFHGRRTQREVRGQLPDRRCWWGVGRMGGGGGGGGGRQLGQVCGGGVTKTSPVKPGQRGRDW
jgi:hypothetical protein